MSSSKGWRRMTASVPTSIERAHIESALRTYVDTWATGDIEGRLALFAPDIVLEDPATIQRATGKTELTTFFAASIPANWKLTFRFIRVAIVGNEAILTYQVTLAAGENAPADLLVNSHAVFNTDGLITSFRTFFDDEAITDSATTGG
jgi:steroid Delta-isomerase